MNHLTDYMYLESSIQHLKYQILNLKPVVSKQVVSGVELVEPSKIGNREFLQFIPHPALPF